MTEEIKEILYKFDKVLENYELDKKTKSFSVDSICHLFPNEMKVMYNYITNLQKENTDLKKLCDKYEEEHKTTFGTWKTVIARNEKASDFILSKAKEYKPHFAKVELNTADCNELLNILEGGDE